MKRKTFVKCLMGMGISRNTANNICKVFVEDFREERRYKAKLTWAYVLCDAMHHDFAMADKFHASWEVFERYMEDNSYKLWKIYSGQFYYNT